MWAPIVDSSSLLPWTKFVYLSWRTQFLRIARPRAIFWTRSVALARSCISAYTSFMSSLTSNAPKAWRSFARRRPSIPRCTLCILVAASSCISSSGSLNRFLNRPGVLKIPSSSLPSHGAARTFHDQGTRLQSCGSSSLLVNSSTHWTGRSMSVLLRSSRCASHTFAWRLISPTAAACLLWRLRLTAFTARRARMPHCTVRMHFSIQLRKFTSSCRART
mmetsp:Transcript_71155/g.200766  ORF Transcript_71155/g.200766 Transcript_71155/m.200766 type:complete len:219 (+) Transcript_71155:948-1604(+)